MGKYVTLICAWTQEARIDTPHDHERSHAHTTTGPRKHSDTNTGVISIKI